MADSVIANVRAHLDEQDQDAVESSIHDLINNLEVLVLDGEGTEEDFEKVSVLCHYSGQSFQCTKSF